LGTKKCKKRNIFDRNKKNRLILWGYRKIMFIFAPMENKYKLI